MDQRQGQDKVVDTIALSAGPRPLSTVNQLSRDLAARKFRNQIPALEESPGCFQPPPPSWNSTGPTSASHGLVVTPELSSSGPRVSSGFACIDLKPAESVSG